MRTYYTLYIIYIHIGKVYYIYSREETQAELIVITVIIQ